MQQGHDSELQKWQAFLGPKDDPVLQLNQPDPKEEKSQGPSQEEILRRQAFFGASPSFAEEIPPSNLGSFWDDLLTLAALIDDEGF